MVKTQLVDPLGRNIGGIPIPNITNVPKSNAQNFGGGNFGGGGASGTWGNPVAPKPETTTQAPAPVVTTPVAKGVVPAIPPVTSVTSEQQQYNILPESVTGVKPGSPVIAPALQAKMDAKKNGVVPVEAATVPENTTIPNQVTSMPAGDKTLDKPVGMTDAEVIAAGGKVENGVQSFPMGMNKDKTNIDPATGKPVETSDLEKQAQATGVAYTMENGQATYNPKTTEEAVKILAMGGKFQGESKMTAVAQAFLNKVRGLGQMTDQQLANNIAGGQVSNKELELLNTMNPQLVAQAKELSKKKVITNTTNEIQADNSAIIKGEEPTGMSKPLTDLLTKLADIDADTKSPAEMKTAYQDAHPEMIQSRDAINAITKQKRNATLAKINLYDEYKAKNSSLPISMIMAGYSALSRDLDNQIYLLNDDLNTEISNYNMYLDDMNAEIEFEIGQQGKEEERLWNIYGVTSKEQIRQEDIEREDKLLQEKIDLEETRYERDIAREDKISAQTRREKIDDMKMEMNMNIETGLMNLGVDPTGMTPEEMRATYSRAIGKQILESKVTPTKWEKTTVRDADGNEVEVFFDPNTGTTRSPSELRGVIFGNTPGNSDVGALALLPGQDLLAVPDGQIVETRLKEVSPQNAKIRGKECAEYVNDVFQQSLFGNTIADKLRVAKDKQGTIGSAAVWTPSGSGNYGHVGIIVDEDENNWYIKSSNLKAGTITTDKVPKSAIKGYYTSAEVKAYQPQQVEKVSNLTLSDISTFNNSTYKPQAEKDKGTKEKYQTFLEEKSAIMKDKKADIYDIMEFSQGGKDLTDSDSKTITKFSQALDQIDGIQKQVKDMKTGPILGRLKELNPYDTKAQVLSASLNALIPNLARGVYGEVGVLTDNDIRQYAKTIPNLKQTNDVNNAVLALTLDTIAGGYKRQLQTLAAAGKDVSGFAGLYESIKAQADSIKSSIPGFNTDMSQEDELEALSIR